MHTGYKCTPYANFHRFHHACISFADTVATLPRVPYATSDI